MAYPIFPKTSLEFLAGLAFRNEKAWFEENRHVYDGEVRPALADILMAAFAAVEDLYPQYNAIPKANKSFFRINRDLRFSKDKSPYKTHLGMLIYRGARMKGTMLYIHIAPHETFVGAGIYRMVPEVLAVYRDMVARPRFNRALGRAYAALRDNFDGLEDDRYKRLPPPHADAAAKLEFPDLLRHRSIVVMRRRPPGDWLWRQDWVHDWAVPAFREAAPMMRLLEKVA